MKPITKLLTKNYTKIPLVYILFNMKKYKQDGAKGSCDCVLHPNFRNDEHIILIMNELCDYIRENYDMDELI